MPTSDPVIDAARELLDRQPGLDPSQAMRQALYGDRDLLRRWHRGEPDQVAPPAVAAEPETIDPGEVLMRVIGTRIALGTSREEAQRQVFAEFPTLAGAWNRGELIPKASSKIGAPAAIVAFKAPMGGTVAGNTITGVEVFRAGEWNGTRYPAKALDDMVAAFAEAGFRPPVTMGHGAAEDALAHGYITRLYRRGDVLLADLAAVPAETIQAIRDGRILSVSAEIYIGLKRGGRTFPYVIRALSLLGAHPPGVNLRPIAESLPAA